MHLYLIRKLLTAILLLLSGLMKPIVKKVIFLGLLVMHSVKTKF